MGSNGKGGRKLVDSFLDSKASVVGVAGQQSQVQDPNYEHITDRNLLFNSDSLSELISEGNFDFVFHLAAIHGPSSAPTNQGTSLELMRKVGLQPTKTMCEAIVRHSPGTRLVVAGSSQVFGSVHSGRKSEHSPMCPENSYATVKAEMRTVVSDFVRQHGLAGSTAILFTHDSWPSPHGFLARTIVDQAIRSTSSGSDTPIFCLLRPNSFLDLSHRDDVVRALRMVAENVESGDFVIGSGKPTSLMELLDEFCDALGLDPPVVQATIDSNSHFGPIADTGRISESVGWIPSREYLEVLLEGYRDLRKGIEGG